MANTANLLADWKIVLEDLIFNGFGESKNAVRRDSEWVAIQRIAQQGSSPHHRALVAMDDALDAQRSLARSRLYALFEFRGRNKWVDRTVEHLIDVTREEWDYTVQRGNCERRGTRYRWLKDRPVVQRYENQAWLVPGEPLTSFWLKTGPDAEVIAVNGITDTWAPSQPPEGAIPLGEVRRHMGRFDEIGDWSNIGVDRG